MSVDVRGMRADLLALLPVGRERAISAYTLAVALGVSERMVGALVAELIEEEGVCIGSLCGTRSGYFLIESLEDLEAGAGHSVRRAAAIFRRIRALRRAWERKPGGVQSSLFELLDVEGPAGLAVDGPSATPVDGVPAASSTASVGEGSGAEEEATELSASFETESPDPTPTIPSGAEASTPTGEGASAPDLASVLASGGWAEWAAE